MVRIFKKLSLLSALFVVSGISAYDTYKCFTFDEREPNKKINYTSTGANSIPDAQKACEKIMQDMKKIKSPTTTQQKAIDMYGTGYYGKISVELDKAKTAAAK